MKIIYLHQYFHTPEMEWSTRSYEIAKRLVLKGHEVHIITSKHNLIKDHSDKKTWTVTMENGIHVYWFPIEYSNTFNFYKRVLSYIKYAFFSFKKGLSLEGDIIYATSTPLTVIIPGFLLSLFKKIPLIFEVRDLWPTLPIAIGALKNPFNIFMARCLEKFAYKFSSKIIALSPGMKSEIVKNGITEDKIYVIPNSCDIKNFSIKNHSEENSNFRKENNIPLENLLITYAGTFGKINNLFYMVNLAEKLKNNTSITFLAVGGGTDFNDVLRDVENKGIKKSFRILKPLPKKNMPTVLCASDISLCIFLPLKEMESNSANKFFDGLASGNMILINYGGWQEDILKKNNAGIRLPENINEAAEIIVELEKNRSNVIEMGENAKKIAIEKFDRDKLTSELEKNLLDVVTRH